MVLDATKPFYHKEILTRELESVGIRLNRDPPNISFKKKKGGIFIKFILCCNNILKIASLTNKLS